MLMLPTLSPGPRPLEALCSRRLALATTQWVLLPGSAPLMELGLLSLMLPTARVLHSMKSWQWYAQEYNILIQYLSLQNVIMQALSRPELCMILIIGTPIRIQMRKCRQRNVYMYENLMQLNSIFIIVIKIFVRMCL